MYRERVAATTFDRSVFRKLFVFQFYINLKKKNRNTLLPWKIVIAYNTVEFSLIYIYINSYIHRSLIEKFRIRVRYLIAMEQPNRIN